jgi:hypothetical protein
MDPRTGEGLRDLDTEAEGERSLLDFDLSEALEVLEVLEREETSELSVSVELMEDWDSE